MMRDVCIGDVLKLGVLHADPLFTADELDSLAASPVTGFSIDSRLVEQGSLFFAVVGERVDGHDFVAQARERGACAAVVERATSDLLPQIEVPSSTKAMGDLARVVREKYKGTLIAITGSSGKTSVKNLCASMLKHIGSVVSTRGNLNNEIGVPLTLASIEAENDFAVVEMGAAQMGDIKYLVDIAKPDIALVNNVGHAHVGRFGSIENTAQAKGEIYDGIEGDGTAVINLSEQFADDFLERHKTKRSKPHLITYGIENTQANLNASSLTIAEEGLYQFELEISGLSTEAVTRTVSFDVVAPQPGMHSVMNLLAASAVCLAAGMSIDRLELILADHQSIAASVADDTGAAGRLSIVHESEQLVLIDDSYNANPESIRVAIDYLMRLSRNRNITPVLALGDMGELGQQSEDLHCDVGRYAATEGVEHLLSVGAYSDHYIRGYLSGNHVGDAKSFATQRDLAAHVNKLQNNLQSIALLVKGSRSSRMEGVIDQLVEIAKQEPSPC